MVSFNRLPSEIKYLVFDYLTPSEACRFASVCKEWRRLLDDNRIWQPLCERAFYYLSVPPLIPSYKCFYLNTLTAEKNKNSGVFSLAIKTELASQASQVFVCNQPAVLRSPSSFLHFTYPVFYTSERRDRTHFDSHCEYHLDLSKESLVAKDLMRNEERQIHLKLDAIDSTRTQGFAIDKHRVIILKSDASFWEMNGRKPKKLLKLRKMPDFWACRDGVITVTHERRISVYHEGSNRAIFSKELADANILKYSGEFPEVTCLATDGLTAAVGFGNGTIIAIDLLIYQVKAAWRAFLDGGVQKMRCERVLLLALSGGGTYNIWKLPASRQIESQLLFSSLDCQGMKEILDFDSSSRYVALGSANAIYLMDHLNIPPENQNPRNKRTAESGGCKPIGDSKRQRSISNDET